MKLQVRASIILALFSAVVPAAWAEPPQACTPKGYVLVCQSPGALISVWPFFWNMFTVSGGGATEPNMRVIHTAKCLIVGPSTRTAVNETRPFKSRDGVATIAHVKFDAPMGNMQDTYSPDGEYRGKARVVYPGGWALKKDLSCPGDSPN
jgi:hypothetical protein